jgi:hypothetical protein
MKRMVQRNCVRMLPFETNDYSEFSPTALLLFQELCQRNPGGTSPGSIRECGPDTVARVKLGWTSDATGAEQVAIELVGKQTNRVFSQEEHDILQGRLLVAYFAPHNKLVQLQTRCIQAKRLRIGSPGTILGSWPGRWARSSFVLTYWPQSGGVCPAQVLHYLQFNAIVTDQSQHGQQSQLQQQQEHKGTGKRKRSTESKSKGKDRDIANECGDEKRGQPRVIHSHQQAPEKVTMYYARVRWFKKKQDDHEVQWAALKRMIGDRWQDDGSSRTWMANEWTVQPEYIPVQNIVSRFIPAYETTMTGLRIFRICALPQHIHI